MIDQSEFEGIILELLCKRPDDVADDYLGRVDEARILLREEGRNLSNRAQKSLWRVVHEAEAEIKAVAAVEA